MINPVKFNTVLVLHVLYFKGIFFYNQKGRRSIAGTNQQLQPTPIPPHSLSTPRPPNVQDGGEDGGGVGGESECEGMGVGWSSWFVPAIDLLPFCCKVKSEVKVKSDVILGL